SRIYSLKPATEGTLRSLDKPVRFYVMFPGKSLIYRETETLLENFRTVTDRVSWTYLDTDQNRRDVDALADKYQLPETRGVLIVYGTEPDEAHEFVPLQNLF